GVCRRRGGLRAGDRRVRGRIPLARDLAEEESREAVMPLYLGNDPSRLSSGKTLSPTAAIIAVTIPPATTANTGVVSIASAPDSNAPSWFDDWMNTRFTADTRPRTSSGVYSCTTVCRITTLMLSIAPTPTSAASESQNEVDIPNTAVARP